MLEEIKRKDWLPFINEFSERNRLRVTRLEVIGNGYTGVSRQPSVEKDFWMEDGLPLVGIGLEPAPDDAPRVEIMLGSDSINPPVHMTHTVEGARRVARTLGVDGRESELEIEGADGAVTILHL